MHTTAINHFVYKTVLSAHGDPLGDTFNCLLLGSSPLIWFISTLLRPPVRKLTSLNEKLRRFSNKTRLQELYNLNV